MNALFPSLCIKEDCQGLSFEDFPDGDLKVPVTVMDYPSPVLSPSKTLEDGKKFPIYLHFSSVHSAYNKWSSGHLFSRSVESVEGVKLVGGSSGGDSLS